MQLILKTKLCQLQFINWICWHAFK